MPPARSSAEGRTLQAVAGKGEHRCANHNTGEWEQWEHSAKHGLLNAKWKKPLGWSIQQVQTVLTDDLREQASGLGSHFHTDSLTFSCLLTSDLRWRL